MFLARREALRRGGEENNGFELWRTLFWEHEGGAQQCQLACIRGFLAPPPMQKQQKLSTRTSVLGSDGETLTDMDCHHRNCESVSSQFVTQNCKT